jgi:hypothetical protein
MISEVADPSKTACAPQASDVFLNLRQKIATTSQEAVTSAPEKEKGGLAPP